MESIPWVRCASGNVLYMNFRFLSRYYGNLSLLDFSPQWSVWLEFWLQQPRTKPSSKMIELAFGIFGNWDFEWFIWFMGWYNWYFKCILYLEVCVWPNPIKLNCPWIELAFGKFGIWDCVFGIWCLFLVIWNNVFGETLE